MYKDLGRSKPTYTTRDVYETQAVHETRNIYAARDVYATRNVYGTRDLYSTQDVYETRQVIEQREIRATTVTGTRDLSSYRSSLAAGIVHGQSFGVQVGNGLVTTVKFKDSTHIEVTNNGYTESIASTAQTANGEQHWSPLSTELITWTHPLRRIEPVAAASGAAGQTHVLERQARRIHLGGRLVQ